MTPELHAAYLEPRRRYHTLEHIDDCLKALGRVEGLSEVERRTLEHAIWWHDAVYDPTRGDNEDMSARMAERDLEARGVGPAERAEVARLIRLTAGHQVEDADRLGALLVSIDLAILGAAPEAYERYASQIREEYAHVPEPLYRAGRAAVIQRFLDAPAIFAHPEFGARLEDQARRNIEAELDRLRA